MMRLFESGRLRRNVAFAAGQSLVVAATLFLSYRLLITNRGVGELGLWALLAAVGSVARLADLSGGGSLGRFLAIHSISAEGVARHRYIVHTITITSVAFNLILAVAAGVGLWLAVPSLVSAEEVKTGIHLVPWVIGSMFASALAGTIASGVDGVQRADQRSMVAITASILYLGVAWALIPRFGLAGLAIAQIAQQLFVMVVCWQILRRHVAHLGWLPTSWSRREFLETTRYTLKLNLIAVAGMLFEPLAKAAIGQSGGTVQVGYYELASRVVTQARGVVVAATAPLVPAMAAIPVSSDQAFRGVLDTANKQVARAALMVTVLSLGGAPLLCLVVLGRLSQEVLFMNALLALGWCANICAIPLYLAGQAMGLLRWNLLSHVAIAIAIVGALLLPIGARTTAILLGIDAGLMGGAVLVAVCNARSLHCTGSLVGLSRSVAWVMPSAALACAVSALITWAMIRP